jgi:hypothetical protein
MAARPTDPDDTPSKDEVEQDFTTPADPYLETGAEPDQPA